ncbi:hypothetical protein TYRP_021556 [Tyrophagus putrescentiae]|nr:hypothetical protein TYRP_021556 [Tyrophagus putrescentiae]
MAMVALSMAGGSLTQPASPNTSHQDQQVTVEAQLTRVLGEVDGTVPTLDGNLVGAIRQPLDHVEGLTGKVLSLFTICFAVKSSLPVSDL